MYNVATDSQHKTKKTMANFNGSVDLMKLAGAKYLAGIDKESPNRTYICIPVNWNDIKVVNDEHSASGLRSTLKLAMYQTSENYVKACIEGKKRKGEDVNDYNPPSHTCEIRYSKDYLEKLREAAKKAVLAEHKEYNTPELQDEKKNLELRNQISDRTRIKLGSMYVRQHLADNDVAPMAEHAAPASVAPASPEGENGNNPEDDLPF